MIRTVRAYLKLLHRPLPAQKGGEFDVFAELESDDVLGVPTAVIDALRQVTENERNDHVLSAISSSLKPHLAAVN